MKHGLIQITVIVQHMLLFRTIPAENLMIFNRT